MTIRTVELPGGPALPYIEQGDPDGIPVLLLHGATDSLRSWEPVLAQLPESIRAVAVTQRGHGDTARPAEAGYRIPDFAADAAALIEELELGPAIVVGHSMGGWVAQALAVDHAELIQGAMLEAAFAAAADNQVLVEFAAEIEALDVIAVEFARDFQHATIGAAMPLAMETFVAESMKLPTWLWRRVFTGFLEVDLTPELGYIEAPTLLVWGDQDLFVGRAEQEWLVSAIPGAELRTYEGTGHAVHWEQPERFTADLVAFVEEVQGRSRTMSASDRSGRSNRALTA